MDRLSSHSLDLDFTQMPIIYACSNNAQSVKAIQAEKGNTRTQQKKELSRVCQNEKTTNSVLRKFRKRLYSVLQSNSKSIYQNSSIRKDLRKKLSNEGSLGFKNIEETTDNINVADDENESVKSSNDKSYNASESNQEQVNEAFACRFSIQLNTENNKNKNIKNQSNLPKTKNLGMSRTKSKKHKILQNNSLNIKKEQINETLTRTNNMEVHPTGIWSYNLPNFDHSSLPNTCTTKNQNLENITFNNINSKQKKYANPFWLGCKPIINVKSSNDESIVEFNSSDSDESIINNVCNIEVYKSLYGSTGKMPSINDLTSTISNNSNSINSGLNVIGEPPIVVTNGSTNNSDCLGDDENSDSKNFIKNQNNVKRKKRR